RPRTVLRSRCWSVHPRRVGTPPVAATRVESRGRCPAGGYRCTPPHCALPSSATDTSTASMYTEPATLPPCRFLAAGRMILAAASLAALVACGGNEADAGESRDAGGSTEFWAALQGICGGAYYGAQVEGND